MHQSRGEVSEPSDVETFAMLPSHVTPHHISNSSIPRSATITSHDGLLHNSRKDIEGKDIQTRPE